MDAPEDGDIKLQRVSDDLLREFAEKLTPLLWKHTSRELSTRTVHRWAQVRKYERLIELVRVFAISCLYLRSDYVINSWSPSKNGHSFWTNISRVSCLHWWTLFWPM